MAHATMTKGQVAVKRAYSGSDIVVLVATFLFFFCLSTLYFVITYFTDSSFASQDHSPLAIFLGISGALFGGLLVFVGALLLGMFMTRLQRQTMLGNSLQIEYSDYAWLRDWANIVAADLQLPRVEIFVTQDPVINAYAFGFAKPYAIVLQSGTIRYLSPEELKAVIVHEMGHIKYGHTQASVYLSPFLVLPFVSIIGTWIAGFWQRRTEFTSDRLALMYMGDSELVKAALIKVHVGPDVARAMNETARQWLQYNAERPMNRVAQTLSNHPFLVRRLSHIDKWKHVIEPAPTAVPPVQQ